MWERNREAPTDGLSYILLYMLSMGRCVQAHKHSVQLHIQATCIYGILKDFCRPTGAEHYLFTRWFQWFWLTISNSTWDIPLKNIFSFSCSCWLKMDRLFTIQLTMPFSSIKKTLLCLNLLNTLEWTNWHWCTQWPFGCFVLGRTYIIWVVLQELFCLALFRAAASLLTSHCTSLSPRPQKVHRSRLPEES